MKADKYDMALGNAAAQDDGHPALAQICFRDGKLAAANGFMLVCRKANTEKGDGFDSAVMIPAKMAKVIKPSAKKLAKMTIKDKKITTTYYDGLGVEVDPKLVFNAGLTDKFPEYQQVFPKGKKYHQYAVSIDLLRTLLPCLPKDGILKLGFMESASSPMEFRVDGLTPADYDCERPIYGMLMPMFVRWDDGNEWQRANEEVIKENKDGN